MFPMFPKHHSVHGFLKICILKMLEKKPMHGYELMKELGAYGWRPSPGSIYPVLASLQRKKLVSVESKANKKVYAITKTGRIALKKIENEKRRISLNMRRALSIVSNFLGEETRSDVMQTKMKINPELMVSMVRIGRKLILCSTRKVPKNKIKKILDRAEREVDALLCG